MSLKKICAVKDKLRIWMPKEKYQISKVYKHVLNLTPQVKWDKFVWNRASIPRARFILWLIMCGKLRTRDKLVTMGVLTTNICPMCNTFPESIEHLYFQCPFSMPCLHRL